MNESFLQKLLGSISVSGYEEPVQKTVEAELSGYAQEIRRDEMGNLVDEELKLIEKMLKSDQKRYKDLPK